ncbi:dihydropteroate synthase, partial [Bradyrhizobium sp. NBAIM20]|nr:dihydropteroate synthase [Bradyrhizobium sp. NBAIM20]
AAVRLLKQEGVKVSVDSTDPDELLRAGRAGADYLLSLNIDTLWIADEVASTPVLISRTPADEPSLYAAIDTLSERGRPFLADPILDPIPFGFTDSIVRYHALRKRYPQAPILMGVGNLTELTEADTTGINALLFGIGAELNIAAVLTTQVSRHA